MRTKIILLILSVSIITNGILGYKFFNTQFNTQDAQQILQERYPLLSKRIFIDNQNDILINFIPLRQALREYVGKQEGKVGVYFEYLPSGTSIGVNDREEIILASLSKVPVVIAILKKVERGQMSLADMLVVKKEHLNQEFGTLWKRGEGTRLSVAELIRLTLTESDNTASTVLRSQLQGQELNDVYKNLDISVTIRPKEDKENLRVSLKNYSSIFRSLYLSSSLSEENSNYILNLLTQTIFEDKIVAGVPDTIKVAHKIGVFEKSNAPQDVFIDCGIIYVPDRPYILCAFILDTDEQAQKHISYISKIIYDYIIAVKEEP